jgi:VanZ family protein
MVKTLIKVFSPDARLRYFNLWLIVGFLLLLAINFSSLVSSVWVPMPGHTDKIYHAISYAILMLWWLQLFPLYSARVILGVLFIGMGIGLEVIQSFDPMRYMDYRDMVANSAGVVIAYVMGLTALDQLLYWFEKKITK